MLAAREGEAGELKRALTDVARVVDGLGLGAGAKRQARGLSICCPVHNERDPSCSVTLGPDGTIRVRCFACDFAGDVFSLIAAAEGLEPRGADWPKVLERARVLAGVAPGSRGGGFSSTPGSTGGASCRRACLAGPKGTSPESSRGR